MAERASLVRLEKEFDIKLDWRGFELHPETPKGGIELRRLFPGEMTPERDDYMQQFAARFGVQGMTRSKRMPNTRRALAVAQFARDQGKLDEYRSRTMDAHWKEGKDIEDSTVLAGLAGASGLDPEKALLAADDPVYLIRVDDTRVEYENVGVGGIPTFVFGSEPVEGCKPYEVLAAAALRAGAKRR
ncbi:DsbA family protein [Chloroflexota bacterium]